MVGVRSAIPKRNLAIKRAVAILSRVSAPDLRIACFF